jgi:ATP-dependent DNA helicase Rep
VTVQLNPDQELAANFVEGPVVVIAGPGAGKTRVLTERYLRMRARGIPDRDILNLTFTNAASKEMLERVGLLNADEVFRTFHSFCLQLLKQERTYLPFPTCPAIIPVRGEQYLLMKDLLKTYQAIKSYHALNDLIGEWKAGNMSPEQVLEEQYTQGEGYFYALAYRDYELKQREQGWLDFDNLVKETVKLLEVNDGVRERNKRKYIAVDECQDTDITQFQLLRLLYSGNIFVVGDENQLIYEWRSAKRGNLSNFAKTFSGAKTLYLGQNYRSTGLLVKFLKSILPVDNGLASHLVSMRPEGVAPRFISYLTEDIEANEVLNDIYNRGIVDDAAILARTNRQLQLIQRRAMSRNIKAEILGKKNVWQENEVKHLIELTKEQITDPRPAATVMTSLIKEHNLVYRYGNTKGGMDKDPIENLNDIVRMAGRKSKSTGQPLTVLQFLDWLRKITHMRHTKTEPILTLATIHAAKGREFRYVYLVGCNQGTLPHKDGELNEEKRIFFVGASRAADELQISFSKNRSQFLNDFTNEIEFLGEEDGQIPN